MCVMFAATEYKYNVDLRFKYVFKDIDTSSWILLLKKLYKAMLFFFNKIVLYSK